MKYAIVKVVNANYFVHAEGITDVKAAKTQYHQLCASLWNAEDVETAEVRIVDENLDTLDGYKEYINKVEAEPVTITNITKSGNTYTVIMSDGTIMTYTENE